MPKTTNRPINTAFAILFMLLISVAMLHVTSVSDAGANTAAVMQMAGDLERFRALERTLCNTTEHLRSQMTGPQAKVAILDIELAQIENTLRDLGLSARSIPGLTRLVEPFAHVREVREQIGGDAPDLEVAFSPGQPLDRALQASLFVVRGNITRLGEGLSAETASMNSMNDRARGVALFTGLAAVLVFLPIRIMANRAAAKPIQALRIATDALGDERWSAAGVDCDSDDAVGDLVSAFRTMASKLQESKKQRAESFNRTLAALVQAIEAKDTFTSDHSCKVSKYAELLARAVGLDEPEIQEVAYGGLLHDIGKIGVPDEIINKPGKLTDDEFRIIKSHPVIGDRIIAPLEGAEMLHPPVRFHHERWDGSGYPDGLAGENIPLIARIICVSDIFEALTSDRPYRQRMSIEQAVGILRDESGSTMDPRLVDVFLNQVLPRIEADVRADDDDEVDPADEETRPLEGAHKALAASSPSIGNPVI